MEAEAAISEAIRVLAGTAAEPLAVLPDEGSTAVRPTSNGSAGWWMRSGCRPLPSSRCAPTMSPTAPRRRD
ncbi:hypothetical protein [Pseudolysinimonas kribbensis]|uniref:hypothetical protein n=1 Tax=Pseudolysinimonas kribbensis TaxID=433641 RepID=UPI0024E09A8D|nr:hypothetical protein [Pseudolysinimonas kribbensis]